MMINYFAKSVFFLALLSDQTVQSGHTSIQIPYIPMEVMLFTYIQLLGITTIGFESYLRLPNFRYTKSSRLSLA